MIVFDSVTIGIPIMEIVESGIKMTVNRVRPGLLLLMNGLHPLYLCRVVFASLGIVAKMCADIPVNVGSARVFRRSAGIRVALARW